MSCQRVDESLSGGEISSAGEGLTLSHTVLLNFAGHVTSGPSCGESKQMEHSKMTSQRWAGLAAALSVLALVQHLPQSVAQAPATTDACSGVNCQQGTCETGLIGFTCKCQEGWQNIMELPFLPCGIPKDCNLNLSCNGNAPAGAPGFPPPAPFALPNFTSFNPCTFSLCGFGKCVPDKNAGLLAIPYTCDCDEGNSNVMNMTAGTCLPDCNFGASCSQLGLPLSNSNTPPPPSTVTTPPGEGSYPPGDTTPGQVGQPPNAVCKSVDCWKGTCTPIITLPGLPQYKCDCEKGWLNPFNIPSLPCSIPNCRIPDVKNCRLLSHPPSFIPPSIQDFLNPCSWPICGEGKCVRNSSGLASPGDTMYTCVCNPGSSNLLNKASSICVPDCCIPECLGGEGGCLAQQFPNVVPAPPPPNGLPGRGNRTEALNAGVGLNIWKKHILAAITISISVCA